jgi:tetratricopeptide (TPR) repeat protein
MPIGDAMSAAHVHVPEDELALYAHDPASLPGDRRIEVERAIGACADCRTTFDFMTVSEGDLADPEVWEPLRGSETLDSLRAHAARIAAEDKAADALLDRLLTAPARTAWKTLPANRKFRTGGVARKLTAHAQRLCRSEPLDALTFAEAAVSVAEALPKDTYAARAVYEIRGSAWRAQANALNFLGRFPEALEACRRAERAYGQLRSPGLGLASVSYVRGCILFEQQQYDAAATAAEIAERGFSHLGQDERQMWAVHLRANIAFEQKQIDAAMSLFQRIADHGDALGDTAWIARGAHALGSCALETGDVATASRHFQVAVKRFRELGEHTEVIRAEWGIARVFLATGKTADGIARLRAVLVAFARAGLVTDAALAGLDLAEALVTAGKYPEIVALALHIYEVFTGAGMLTGALAAMMFLRDAANTRTLSNRDINVIRAFLRRAERHPALVFVDPPRDSS